MVKSYSNLVANIFYCKNLQEYKKIYCELTKKDKSFTGHFALIFLRQNAGNQSYSSFNCNSFRFYIVPLPRITDKYLWNKSFMLKNNQIKEV